MTADEKRASVIKKYDIILGRNKYSQSLRAYCYTKYKDGKYYSDCSSSISYAYKEAGLSFGILNTVGMYNSSKLKKVDVTIKNGIIQNKDVLRIGDMLLFAGTDSGRASAGYVGHVEMIYSISGSTIKICGHGSGTPRVTSIDSYCKSRYNAKTSTKLGNKGLIKVVRYLQDSDIDMPPVQDKTENNMKAGDVAMFEVTGNTVNIREKPNTDSGIVAVVKKGARLDGVKAQNGFVPILYNGQVRWISEKYVKEA